MTRGGSVVLPFSFTTWQRYLFVWGGLVLTVATLYWARPFVIPVVLAVLLTFILTPLVSTLERTGLGRVVSALVVVALVAVLVGGIGWTVTAQVQGLVKELPEHKNTIIEKIHGLLGTGDGLTGSIFRLIKEVGDEVIGRAIPGEQSGTSGQPIPVVIKEPARPVGLEWFPAILGPLFDVLAGTALVVVLVVFMLVRREDLRNRVIRLVGSQRLTTTTKALDDVARRISRFLAVQVLINFCFGSLLGIGLFLIGVPYPLLWGLLGCLFRFVPYVGTWLLATFLMLFCVAVFPGWTEPLLTFSLFLVLEVLAANVAEPLLFGRGMGVSPVALLIAAAFWVWLWGPIGLILSIPITACLAVLGRHVPQLGFLSILLGDDPGLDTEISYYQRLLARDQDEATDLVEEYLRSHNPETVYDEVLVPALVLAQRDEQRGELAHQEKEWIVEVTREIIRDYLPLHPQDGTASPSNDSEPKRRTVLVAGCPANGAADELALEMLRQLVEPDGCRFEVLSTNMLAAEVVARVRRERPVLVVIAALPPAGLAQTRYLCKRFRADFPDLKIAVGRWGLTEGADKMRERLRDAGADLIGTTILETREQIVPLIQALSHVENNAFAHTS
jgi:predicted PurR-regulated permease PerM